MHNSCNYAHKPLKSVFTKEDSSVSLVRRPPLAAFFAAVEKCATRFSMAMKKAARGGLGMRL